ncbi:hypothetical protein ACQQ2N_12750 [Dokdonella sp. MW10]|uniref:hypothetical protein n=1 Tax=Dokdonella sp. MW10 TaxID=2992926 RepID=UPI003F7DA8C4
MGARLSAPTAPRRYRWGAYRIDVAARLLTFDGVPIALADDAFAVIACLVARRGATVDVAGLARAIDPARSVAAPRVHAAVRAARRALNDRTRPPGVILGAPASGYAWGVPVRRERPRAVVLHASADEAPTDATAREAYEAGAAFGAALVLAAAAWFAWP